MQTAHSVCGVSACGSAGFLFVVQAARLLLK
jgi:hypothetical protein